MSKPLAPDQMDLLRREQLSQSVISDQQRAFCEEYVRSFNKLLALKAGNFIKQTYQPKGGVQLAMIQRKFDEVMAVEGVQKHLALLRQSVVSRLGFSYDDIIEQYKAMAFARMDDYISWDNGGVTIRSHELLTTAQRAGIMEVTETPTKHGKQIKFKLFDRKSSLDRLYEILKDLQKLEKEEAPVKISPAQINILLGDPMLRRAVEYLAAGLFDKQMLLTTIDKERQACDENMQRVNARLLERMNEHTSTGGEITGGAPEPGGAGRLIAGPGPGDFDQIEDAIPAQRGERQGPVDGDALGDQEPDMDTEPDRYPIDGL
jgi:hypothetical protein